MGKANNYDDYIDSRHSSKPCLGYCMLIFSALALSVGFLFLILFIGLDDKAKVKETPSAMYQKVRQLAKVGQSDHNKISKKNPVAILMYHYIREVEDKTSDELGYSLSVSPTEFEKQMNYLSKNDFNVITFKQFLQGEIGERALILTFDDGYEDFYTSARPILEKYQFPATVYMITSRIDQGGYLTKNEIKKLSDNPLFSIGSHSATHPNFFTASQENQIKEIIQSQTSIRDITGAKPADFCFPSGQYSPDSLKILAQYNFKTAVTTEERLAFFSDNHLALPRVRVQGSLGLDGFVEKLSDFFKSYEASATSPGI